MITHAASSTSAISKTKQIFSGDAILPVKSDFKVLSQKILKSADEIKVGQAFDVLESNEKNFVQKNEYERMEAVDFITQSIRFNANPNRTAIINRLRDLLSTPLANKKMEKRQQQSLYGDRMECFLLLATLDRETAKNVIRRLR